MLACVPFLLIYLWKYRKKLLVLADVYKRQDLAFVTSIPNFTVLTPADPEQLYEAVKYAAEIQGPVYIRGGSGREVDVYAKDDIVSADGLGAVYRCV